MAFQMTTKKNLSKNSKDIIFQIAGMANDAIEKVGKENVVNGTFGAILDEEGKLVFLKTVKEEYLSLSDQDHAGYAPIEGLHDFLEAAISECFGQSRPEGYIRALSTSGGTGGVHHLVHNYTRPGDTVLTADWFWAAYRTISEDADRVLDTYTLFNPDNSFNFDSLKEKVLALADKQENVLVIFNTPGNNPTGYSISEADWDRILDLFKSIVDQGKNKIIIGADVAYLDYSGEKEATRRFFKKFGNLPERILTVVCYSTSKGFTLYGQRVGAMIGITSNEEVAEEFFNENKMTSRGTWSNNTRPAMKAVANIVSTVPSSRINSRTSLPRMSGAAMKHQRVKWLRFSSAVKSPLPTSSISGSFQLPLPEYLKRLTLTSYMPRTDFQFAWISGVVRQRLPAAAPQRHERFLPHSQME